jgi:hypothetical protein
MRSSFFISLSHITKNKKYSISGYFHISDTLTFHQIIQLPMGRRMARHLHLLLEVVPQPDGRDDTNRCIVL